MNDIEALLGLEEFAPRKKRFANGGTVSRNCGVDQYCPSSILRQSFDDGGEVSNASPFSGAQTITTPKSSKQKAIDTMDNVAEAGGDTLNNLLNATMQYKIMKMHADKKKALQKKPGSKDDFQIGMKKPMPPEDPKRRTQEDPARYTNQPPYTKKPIEPLSNEINSKINRLNEKNKNIEMTNLRNNPQQKSQTYREISDDEHYRSLNPYDDGLPHQQQQTGLQQNNTLNNTQLNNSSQQQNPYAAHPLNQQQNQFNRPAPMLNPYNTSINQSNEEN